MVLHLSEVRRGGRVRPLRGFFRAFALVVTLAAVGGSQAGIARGPESRASAVRVIRVPDGGIQPQAVVDAHGVLHLLYFKGDAAHGNLFYVHRPVQAAVDAPFSPPLRVNSQPNSAIAIGTIRGGQLAVGPEGTVSVVWNGSNQAPEGGDGTTPFLFSRLKAGDTAFEPERNLLTGSEVIDGGGSVAVDPKRGSIYVLWHSVQKGTNEVTGGVYLAKSADGGATFGPVQQLATASFGTCGCCGMRAAVGGDGTVYVLYRAAREHIDRDTMLLTSTDGGATFAQTDLQAWRINACPMSLFGLAAANEQSGIVGAWETQGHIQLADLATGAASPAASVAVVQAPRSFGGAQKYPVLAVAPDGTRLVAWAEGTGWQRGGALAYQLYDAAWHPLGNPGRVAGGVGVWDLPAVVAAPDGSFLLFP